MTKTPQQIKNKVEKEDYDLDELFIKDEIYICDHNNYMLVWVDQDGDLSNPKSLCGMNLEKAKGSLIWTKRCLGKDFNAFVYDPEVFSIYNDDGSVNKELVESMIIDCGRFRDRK
jgi:hypothetical protein